MDSITKWNISISNWENSAFHSYPAAYGRLPCTMPRSQKPIQHSLTRILPFYYACVKEEERDTLLTMKFFDGSSVALVCENGKCDLIYKSSLVTCMVKIRSCILLSHYQLGSTKCSNGSECVFYGQQLCWGNEWIRDAITRSYILKSIEVPYIKEDLRRDTKLIVEQIGVFDLPIDDRSSAVSRFEHSDELQSE